MSATKSQKIVRKLKKAKSYLDYLNLSLTNSKSTATIREVKDKKLSYLETTTLGELTQAVIKIDRQQIPGIIVETGCALGGSSIVIASNKSRDRELFVYDVFGMIPPPSDRDDKDVHQRYEVIKQGESIGLGGDLYYGYEDNLYDKVAQSFIDFDLNPTEHNIHLVKGLYEDTLHVDRPVALAHIDCDWYESVLTCLKRIEPHVVKGGILVIDDYYHWSGCQKAVDEYFQNLPDSSYKFIHKTRLHIIKQ
ncbi:MAG: TylF/MycF/NovP-related O-methyltransferase [Pleurocapsa sp.]